MSAWQRLAIGTKGGTCFAEQLILQLLMPTETVLS